MAGTKKGWEVRKEKYGKTGFLIDQLPAQRKRMLKARLDSPTIKRGSTKSPETRKRISETVKQRWEEGCFRNSEKCLFRNQHNKTIKKKHDAELKKLIEQLVQEGHELIFADLPLHSRPDAITFYNGEVHSWDVKLGHPTLHWVLKGG